MDFYNVLATRYTETAEALGKQMQDQKTQTSKLVQKIKAFFRIGG